VAVMHLEATVVEQEGCAQLKEVLKKKTRKSKERMKAYVTKWQPQRTRQALTLYSDLASVDLIQ